MAQKSGIVTVLAQNVRRLRTAAKLSQEDLALEAGLDRTYISQVERSLRNVTIEVLARLAKALGTGRAKDTVIVLWSDHGYHLGENGRWGKQSCYETATRAPLIVSSPACRRGAPLIHMPPRHSHPLALS